MKQTSKYLLANDRDAQWGLTISTVGYEEIAPGDSYPTVGHADGYYFHVDRGRELQEYQLLYITEGEGRFCSAHHRRLTTVKEGDMFVLFPGEWHTYYPLIDKGWKSYWIGFKGRNMDERVSAGFLTPAKPVYHVGFSDEIVQLYRSALSAAADEAGYMQQLLAGQVNYLIGMMYSLERNIELGRNQQHVDMVSRARLLIRESLETSLSIQEVAEQLGVSYSNFRKLFKEHTGLSPATYQQDLRLQRAKELLTTTDMSVKEIAYRLNFESPDYFSAKFKIKTGRRPSELRNTE